MESLRSLEFFDKTNRSRELSKSAVMRTLADPEGTIPALLLSSELWFDLPLWFSL